MFAPDMHAVPVATRLLMCGMVLVVLALVALLVRKKS